MGITNACMYMPFWVHKHNVSHNISQTKHRSRLLMFSLQVNTFQCITATNSDADSTYVFFLYRDIQWASSTTTIGFNGGSQVRRRRATSSSDSFFFNLPESSAPELLLDLEETSNVGSPGIYVFQVDGVQVASPLPGKAVRMAGYMIA